MTKTSNAR